LLRDFGILANNDDEFCSSDKTRFRPLHRQHVYVADDLPAGRDERLSTLLVALAVL
jgi:hypothetical protein